MRRPALVEDGAVPQRDVRKIRSTCDDMRRDRGGEQHECTDAQDANERREVAELQSGAYEQTSQPERGCFRGCLHPCEHVGHPEHADCGQQRERGSGDPHDGREDVDHSGCLRSTYVAYATVPTKPTSAMTMAASSVADTRVDAASTT